MAHQAAVKEVGNGELRRLLAHNKSFGRTNVAIGDSVLFYRTVNSKSTPRSRGPAKILDIDNTGVTAKFHSQSF